MTKSLLKKCFNTLKNYEENIEQGNQAQLNDRFPNELIELYKNNDYIHQLQHLRKQQAQEIKIYNKLNSIIKDKEKKRALITGPCYSSDFTKLLYLRWHSHDRLFSLKKEIRFLTHCKSIKQNDYFKLQSKNSSEIKNKQTWKTYHETIENL